MCSGEKFQILTNYIFSISDGNYGVPCVTHSNFSVGVRVSFYTHRKKSEILYFTSKTINKMQFK